MQKVLVLMSTYNGDKYLEEQLNSIFNQNNVSISILVRDDGSTDNTLTILDKWKEKAQLDYYTGENKKSALSFFDLILHAQDYDYYAFSDQDDVWLPNKLISALEQLEKVEKHNPAMYFSQLTYVDDKLNIMEKQFVFSEYLYSFSQALIKNMVAGCTLVYNAKLGEILKSYVPENISMHDRWIYLVCSAVGGKIIFDKKSYILYRQHSSNVTRHNNFIQLFRARIKRLFDSSQFIYMHAYMLNEGYVNLITTENKICIEKVINYKKGIKYKLSLLKDKSFRIQSNKCYKKGITDFWSYVSCPSNLSFIIKIVLSRL